MLLFTVSFVVISGTMWMGIVAAEADNPNLGDETIEPAMGQLEEGIVISDAPDTITVNQEFEINVYTRILQSSSFCSSYTMTVYEEDWFTEEKIGEREFSLPAHEVGETVERTVTAKLENAGDGTAEIRVNLNDNCLNPLISDETRQIKVDVVNN